MAAKPLDRTTVSVQGVWLLAEAARARGLDVVKLLTRHGLETAIGADIDARVPALAVLGLWAELPQAAGLPTFGIWLAELACAAKATSLGAHLVHSAKTLGAGLARLLEFERVLHGVNATQLHIQANRVVLSHQAPLGAGPGATPAIEFAFAWILGTARITTQQTLHALAVNFSHATPDNLAEYSRFFGVTPRFRAAHNELVLPRACLDWPQKTADELLERLSKRHAETELAELPPNDSWNAQVSSWLRHCFACGQMESATLHGAANSLNIAERTLQRRLAQEGVTFNILLDTARHEQALRYLTDGRVSVAEVAFALGFADQATFHRAFVRWTQMTPGEYKKRPGNMARNAKTLGA